MQSLPFAAGDDQIHRQKRSNSAYVPAAEPVVLLQLDWAAGAMQVKHHLAAVADNVNMRRPMIVRIDYDAQSGKAQYSWHDGLSIT
jgi:hypothetical protein